MGRYDSEYSKYYNSISNKSKVQGHMEILIMVIRKKRRGIFLGSVVNIAYSNA